MKRTAPLFACALLLVLAAAAPAQAGKLYFGASVGRSSADLGISDVDDGSITSGAIDDSDSTLTAFVGFRIFKFLAIEGDWTDLGTVSIDAISDGTGTDFMAGPVTASADVDGYRVSAVAVIPIGQRLSILGRYGVFTWESSSAITNAGMTVSESTDDADEFYGAGIAWQFRKSLSLRVEYQSLTVDETDVELYSAGLAFRF